MCIRDRGEDGASTTIRQGRTQRHQGCKGFPFRSASGVPAHAGKLSRLMNLYHRTYQAEAIIRGGFHNVEVNYRTSTPDSHYGVWVSDEPLDEREGALGNVV